jgi:ribose transport system substrate-binding protein
VQDLAIVCLSRIWDRVQSNFNKEKSRMNVRKVLSQLLALLMIAVMVISCAPQPTPAPTAAAPAAATPAAAAAAPTQNPALGVPGKVLYNVGFLKGHPVIRLMTLGFVVGCEELGYKYKLLLSDGSDYAQMSASMEQAIAEKADGIVTFASDPSLKPVIDRAGKASIPLVSAHFPAAEGDYPGLTAWVAADTVKYAQDVAAAMGAELQKRGIKSGTIAVTQGNFNTVENLVAKTFTADMNKNFPEFKVLAAQEEGFDPPVAIAKASAIISANPDIVGAMSTTGAGPTTWARGAEETGKKDGEIVIISMDYTRPNLDLVKAGKVFGLVGQPLFQEFHDAVYILDKVFKGEKFDYANPMVAPIITQATMDTYYKLNDDVEAKLGAGANAAATPKP